MQNCNPFDQEKCPDIYQCLILNAAGIKEKVEGFLDVRILDSAGILLLSSYCASRCSLFVYALKFQGIGGKVRGEEET